LTKKHGAKEDRQQGSKRMAFANFHKFGRYRRGR
jgi:hypothetical protein